MAHIADIQLMIEVARLGPKEAQQRVREYLRDRRNRLTDRLREWLFELLAEKGKGRLGLRFYQRRGRPPRSADKVSRDVKIYMRVKELSGKKITSRFMTDVVGSPGTELEFAL